MLRLFYLMNLFFEDVYREISVREYARLRGLSPPTASTILKQYEKENLLISNKRGIYLFFRANKGHYLFRGISQLYWQDRLYKITEELEKKVLSRRIVLFGSVVKAENTINSDIDLFIDIPYREIDTRKIEKKLKRKIQLHFKNILKNPLLKKNIERGIVIR